MKVDIMDSLDILIVTQTDPTVTIFSSMIMEYSYRKSIFNPSMSLTRNSLVFNRTVGVVRQLDNHDNHDNAS